MMSILRISFENIDGSMMWYWFEFYLLFILGEDCFERVDLIDSEDRQDLSIQLDVRLRECRDKCSRREFDLRESQH